MRGIDIKIKGEERWYEECEDDMVECQKNPIMVKDQMTKRQKDVDEGFVKNMQMMDGVKSTYGTAGPDPVTNMYMINSRQANDTQEAKS